MPRRPDLPCAGCGELMWNSTTSLPEGEARCRPCRRATPKQKKQAPVHCLDCGTAAWGERCKPCLSVHRAADAMPELLKRRMSGRRRRYLDRNAPGFNREEKRAALLAMWQRQGRGCAYCDGPAESVDHVIPLSRGGTNHEGNLMPCCDRCNRRKADRLLTEWRYGKTAVRLVINPPAPRPPQPKPLKWVDQAFSICLQCSALHYGKARCCSPECERERNRVEMRNKYRERVGIPADAPLWSRAGDAA